MAFGSSFARNLGNTTINRIPIVGGIRQQGFSGYAWGQIARGIASTGIPGSGMLAEAISITALEGLVSKIANAPTFKFDNASDIKTGFQFMQTQLKGLAQQTSLNFKKVETRLSRLEGISIVTGGASNDNTADKNTINHPAQVLDYFAFAGRYRFPGTRPQIGKMPSPIAIKATREAIFKVIGVKSLKDLKGEDGGFLSGLKNAVESILEGIGAWKVLKTLVPFGEVFGLLGTTLLALGGATAVAAIAALIADGKKQVLQKPWMKFNYPGITDKEMEQELEYERRYGKPVKPGEGWRERLQKGTEEITPGGTKTPLPGYRRIPGSTRHKQGVLGPDNQTFVDPETGEALTGKEKVGVPGRITAPERFGGSEGVKAEDLHPDLKKQLGIDTIGGKSSRMQGFGAGSSVGPSMLTPGIGSGVNLPSDPFKGAFGNLQLNTGSDPNKWPDLRGQGGSASVRYNNIGAMVRGPEASMYGGIGEHRIVSGKIEEYPTAVQGIAANMDRWKNFQRWMGENNTNVTLGQAIATWSGGHSVGAYISVLRKHGLDPDMIVTPEMTKDAGFMKRLLLAQSDQEGGQDKSRYINELSDADWQAAHSLFMKKSWGEQTGEPGTATIPGQRSQELTLKPPTRRGATGSGAPTDWTQHYNLGLTSGGNMIRPSTGIGYEHGRIGDVEGVVLHWTGDEHTNAQGIKDAKTLRKGGYTAGPQFRNARGEGNIVQIVPDYEKVGGGYGIGKMNHTRNGMVGGREVSNSRYIGIENQGGTGGKFDLDDPQTQRLIKWLGWAGRRYRFDPRKTTFGHGETDPDRRPDEMVEFARKIRSGEIVIPGFEDDKAAAASLRGDYKASEPEPIITQSEKSAMDGISIASGKESIIPSAPDKSFDMTGTKMLQSYKNFRTIQRGRRDKMPEGEEGRHEAKGYTSGIRNKPGFVPGLIEDYQNKQREEENSRTEAGGVLGDAGKIPNWTGKKSRDEILKLQAQNNPYIDPATGKLKGNTYYGPQEFFGTHRSLSKATPQPLSDVAISQFLDKVNAANENEITKGLSAQVNGLTPDSYAVKRDSATQRAIEDQPQDPTQNIVGANAKDPNAADKRDISQHIRSTHHPEHSEQQYRPSDTSRKDTKNNDFNTWNYM